MNTPDIPGFSNFRILRKGTFFTIWMAHQDSLDRDVEVHRFSEALSDEQIAHQMRMVRVVSRLGHPSIPGIIDINPSDVPPYFVIEHSAAPSLSDLVEKNGSLSAKDAIRIAGKIAEALAYIGAQTPLVIRNLKPQNILVEDDGNVRIVDFSLAIISNDPADGPSIDGDDIVGTPNFVSPEHAAGSPGIDQRADMYSLGAVLYYVTTRRVPFDCDDVMRTLELQKIGQLPSPREFNPALSAQFVAFLARLMMKDPQCRYASWGDVLSDVKRLQANRPMSSCSPHPDAVSTIMLRNATTGGGSKAAERTATAVTSGRRVHPLAWCVLILWLAWLANCRLANPIGLPDCIAPDISIGFIDDLVSRSVAVDDMTRVGTNEVAEVRHGEEEVPSSADEDVSDNIADDEAESVPNDGIAHEMPSAEYAELAGHIGKFLRAGDVRSAYDVCSRINSVAANEAAKLLDGLPQLDVAVADAILKHRNSTASIVYMGKKREVEPISYAGSQLTVKFTDPSGVARTIQMDVRKIDEAQKLALIDADATTLPQHALAAITALKLGDDGVLARHAPYSGVLSKVFEAMR